MSRIVDIDGFDPEPTEKQLNYVRYLMREAGFEWDEISDQVDELESMTRSEVSEWIDEFKRDYGVE